MKSDEFLWVEKYRPKTIADTILPESTKKTFLEFLKQGNIPNLILFGPPGIGKTTSAKALVNQLGGDYCVINGSKDGNIDTLRTDILKFASSMSFLGGRKYVIFDEADYLNPNSTMPALRNFMEEFSKNCGFILTCNYLEKIIEPLRSRCALISFRIPENEKISLAKQMIKMACNILDHEKVKYDKNSLREIIIHYFPDFRKTINELQRYSVNGEINSGILTNYDSKVFEDLYSALREKSFIKMRNWAAQNIDLSPNYIFSFLFNNIQKFVEKETIPQCVLILSEYQYKNAFAADAELNLVACFVEIMGSCTFK